jgi:hypothetical protein
VGTDRKTDHVDTQRTVTAQRALEDKSARRTRIDQEKRRRAADQRELERLYERREQALRAEKRALEEELAGAAEREIDLDKRAKRSSIVNTIVTTVVAAGTALGSVGMWAASRMERAAEERAAEEARRAKVSNGMGSNAAAIKELSDDLAVHKDAQAKVNAEQQKVNTVQLLRGQRVQTMMELSLKRSGRKPPKKDPEQIQAECAAGLESGPVCDVDSE